MKSLNCTQSPIFWLGLWVGCLFRESVSEFHTQTCGKVVYIETAPRFFFGYSQPRFFSLIALLVGKITNKWQIFRHKILLTKLLGWWNIWCTVICHNSVKINLAKWYKLLHWRHSDFLTRPLSGVTFWEKEAEFHA